MTPTSKPKQQHSMVHGLEDEADRNKDHDDERDEAGESEPPPQQEPPAYDTTEGDSPR